MTEPIRIEVKHVYTFKAEVREFNLKLAIDVVADTYEQAGSTVKKFFEHAAKHGVVHSFQQCELKKGT